MNITPERDFENTLQGPSENPEKQSGRDRLFNSVIWSWGGHFVFIIAGFLLPGLSITMSGRMLWGFGIFRGLWWDILVWSFWG